jgi:hypothetical protein
MPTFVGWSVALRRAGGAFTGALAGLGGALHAAAKIDIVRIETNAVLIIMGSLGLACAALRLQ